MRADKPGFERMRKRVVGLLIGISLLLRGDKRGFQAFGNDARAVYIALAPQVAYLVLYVLSSSSIPIIARLDLTLGSLVWLLVQLIVTEALARRWGCSDQWPRFTAAYLWTSWPRLILYYVIFALIYVSQKHSALIPLALFAIVFGACYILWLIIFLLQEGLSLNLARAFKIIGALAVALFGVLIIAAAVPPSRNIFIDLNAISHHDATSPATSSHKPLTKEVPLGTSSKSA